MRKPCLLLRRQWKPEPWSDRLYLCAVAKGDYKVTEWRTANQVGWFPSMQSYMVSRLLGGGGGGWGGEGREERGAGLGYSWHFGWKCAARSWKFLPYSDLAYILISGPVMSGNFGRVGLRNAPNNLRVFSLLDNVRGNTLLLKWYLRANRRNTHPISQQKGKVRNLFQTRNARIWYPFRRYTPIYGLYMEYPPPPSPVLTVVILFAPSRSHVQRSCPQLSHSHI